MPQNLIFYPSVSVALASHRLTDPIMATLVLEQLRLWHDLGNGFLDADGNLWLHPSVEDWEQTAGTTFSPWKVKSILCKLDQLGYVIREKFCKLCARLINPPDNLRGDNHTKLLRLNWERLTLLWGTVEANSGDGSDLISDSDSETDSFKSESDSETDSEFLKSESESDSEPEVLKSESEEIPPPSPPPPPPPPSPQSPEDEQMQLMAEVKNATGKLTPQLQRLIAEVAPDILRAALAKYPRDGSVKKSCSYLMKIIDQIKAEHATNAKITANQTTNEQMKQWFVEACRAGLILHDETEFSFLPVKMGQLCCRVAIPNRRPNDPPYDLRPLVELMQSA